MTALTVVPIRIMSAGPAVVSRGLAPLLFAVTCRLAPEGNNQNTKRKEERIINITLN